MGEVPAAIHAADGTIDALFHTPEGAAPWPAVIMFTDIMGVRPANLGMARRLAGEGFAVLLPNPFYRIGPGSAAMPPGSMGDPGYLEKLLLLKDDLTPGRVRADTAAMLGWLQGRPDVVGKVGAVGYCMSGGYALRAAADFPCAQTISVRPC
jgi:carboxymethylenebutenolidase